MTFKKLTWIEKIRLKFTDAQSYEFYKFSLKEEKFRLDAQNLRPVNLDHLYKIETRFKHSGNAGDIIYSLPAVFALAKNGTAHLYLNTNQVVKYPFYHPLGNVMLNDKMLEMLKPLLLFQPMIKECDKYDGQAVDYDLDLFRTQPFHLNKGSITRWYCHIFGIYPDTSQPWLTAPKNESMRDFIVIARTHRYRSPGINYSFLHKYGKIIFLGLPIEYQDLKKELPELIYHPVNDFLETASIINGCRLFIGNQSFAFALAEGLKVNRLLEIYFEAPNVIPEGKGAHDFVYQPHFEKAVDMLYNSSQ